MSLEHRYGHRDIVDMIGRFTVERFGFCSSYTEACKYRKNAATTQGVDLVNEIGDSFAQYQADNVDHASKTLDGNGVIPVMGQMATFTAAVKTKRVVPRMEVNMNDLKNIGHMKLITQRDPKDIQANIVYTRLGEVDLAEQHTSWICYGAYHCISRNRGCTGQGVCR